MADYTEQELTDFIRESNRIEGISREPADAELAVAREFLEGNDVIIVKLCALVSIFQPGAVLRNKIGLNVRVGGHIAPPGGQNITDRLARLLDRIRANAEHPYLLHREYETQHPFTDGNGRSGRLLWAWQMLKFGYAPGIELGFLHAWYYQSLQNSQK